MAIRINNKDVTTQVMRGAYVFLAIIIILTFYMAVDSINTKNEFDKTTQVGMKFVPNSETTAMYETADSALYVYELHNMGILSFMIWGLGLFFLYFTILQKVMGLFKIDCSNGNKPGLFIVLAVIVMISVFVPGIMFYSEYLWPYIEPYKDILDMSHLIMEE